MLEATALVTLVLGKYVDALVIVALLLFNAGMSLWREGKAKAAMAALKQKLRIQSRVKRDGKWIIIPARGLVPGDMVRVRIGDFLPADVKIVDGSLGLDQSQLTGESVIVDKSVGEVAYSGSAVRVVKPQEWFMPQEQRHILERRFHCFKWQSQNFTWRK